MEKIVVLGGSFNPPTIGHYLLMQSAIKMLEPIKAYFYRLRNITWKEKCHVRMQKTRLCLIL